MANYTPDVSQDYTGSYDELVNTEYIVKEEEVERELNLDIIPHPGEVKFDEQPGKFIHSSSQFDFDVHSLSIL